MRTQPRPHQKSERKPRRQYDDETLENPPKVDRNAEQFGEGIEHCYFEMRDLLLKI